MQNYDVALKSRYITKTMRGTKWLRETDQAAIPNKLLINLT